MYNPQVRPLAVGAASILAFICLGWGMIRASAPAYDEPVHLASGYSCLVGGPRCLNEMDHPPFGEIWSALPLLWLRPLSFFDSPEWIERRVYHYADLFLYKNRVPAERLLNSARLWCLISWAVLFGAGILEWSSRLWGPRGMAAAGLLFAFCPPLIANAALVTTDAPSAAFYFLTFRLFSFEPRTRLRWVLAGLAMGLGLASKFSMVLLPLVVAAALLLERRIFGGMREGWVNWILMGTATLAALAAVYRVVGLPYYWEGLSATFSRLAEGRASFLFGSYFTQGSLLYFPVALAVKTPIPLLLAAGAGLVASSERGRDGLWLILPPALYFAAACLSRTQIGYRHILPVIPFLIVMGAGGAARAWGRWPRALAALGVWLCAGVLHAHPHHLAYFNEAAGGPGNGYRILLDSNLDWGQGLKALAEELRRRGNPPVFLSYFGMADPSYYGMRYFPLGIVSHVERGGNSEPGDWDPALLAVSATNLQGLYYRDRGVFSWLKSRTPVFTAGHSIFLYDLSADPEGAGRLAYLLEKNGSPGAARRLLLKYGRMRPSSHASH